MKIVVIPGADGKISNGRSIMGQPIPDEARLIEVPQMEIGSCEVAFLRENGAVDIVPDYRSWGPWFDQNASTAERLTARHIRELGIVPPNPNGHPVSPGWENMAMEARAETSAEEKARKKAEAEAKAAEEAEKIANLEVGSDQLCEAAFRAGLISATEAAAWGGAGQLPAPLLTAIQSLPQGDRELASVRAASRLRYKRSDPLLEKVWLAIPGVTKEALDALFVSASQIT